VDIDDLCPSRRSVLKGVAALGVVLAPGVLTACSSSSGGSTPELTANGSGQLPASEVPVGKARIAQVGDQRLVVAQPSQGTFVAFSSICTHQGGHVNANDDLIVTCPLHGSRFDAGHEGKVVNGPAQAPLPPVSVRQQGADLVFG
jgi:nitrite reductase/ring-hydroxylating ferredoxin subunit